MGVEVLVDFNQPGKLVVYQGCQILCEDEWDHEEGDRVDAHEGKPLHESAHGFWGPPWAPRRNFRSRQCSWLFSRSNKYAQSGYIWGRVGGRPKLVLDRDQVRRLRNEGKSLREISDTMGLSLTTTARILK